MTKEVEELERVIIRFAGDSGDGMQLTGSRFTDATAVVGNDLATLPSFPAEIRARRPGSQPSRSTSPPATSSRRAITPTCWSP
jgi:2-oxoglutarate/2-oxoacid ferredoxin oxidoreductase subunit alpha